VYGQISPPNSSVETDPLDPRSPYSSSKASSDLFALSYYSTHKLPVIVTRCCNNYGPRQFPEKLIPLFVTNLFEHRKVPVYGDGKQIREWIHVDDHNRAIDFVIAHGKPGQIYNIGSGVGKENIEITKLLLEMLGRDDNYIKYVEDRKGHDRRYSIDCSKLMAMGWRPTHSFESGIEETVKWYLNNENWWRPLKHV
jgi:dTDP-glucose 4,6-dehydratase